MPPATQLGLHAYRWSTADQASFLRGALAPAADEARARGLCERLWYTLFDARGPHVFALFAVPAPADSRETAERRQDLAAFLHRELGGWLEANPSRSPIDRAEAERRHDACRGKRLSEVDGKVGLVATDSLVLFDHAGDGYPFGASRDVQRAGELWREIDALTRWTLRHCGDAGAAVRLVAAIDAALGALAREFWSYVASTWLVPLRGGAVADAEPAVAALAEGIGERNARLFGQLWQAADRPVPAGRVAALTLDDDGRTLERRFALLREVLHNALAQLLQSVRQRIPLVLYAWRRNADRAPVLG